MTDVPKAERDLIIAIYRELSPILNERIARAKGVNRIKVATAAMSITTAWILGAVAENEEGLAVAEEAFVRSLKLHLDCHRSGVK